MSPFTCYFQYGYLPLYSFYVSTSVSSLVIGRPLFLYVYISTPKYILSKHLLYLPSNYYLFLRSFLFLISGSHSLSCFHLWVCFPQKISNSYFYLLLCLDRLVPGIAGSNPARGMDVCLCVSVWCCPMQVEVFATSWSLVQRSPTKCPNKITKPSVWGGQGPYRDCIAAATAADDDADYSQWTDQVTCYNILIYTVTYVFLNFFP
jgi:hypothetical protein